MYHSDKFVMAVNNSSFTSGSNTCPLFDGDITKCNTLIIIKRVTVSLSIIGSLFTVSVIILFKKFREPSQRMIAHLSSVSFIWGVSYLMNDIETEKTLLCKIQGACLSFCVWAVILWVLAILLNLYFQILFGFDILKFEVAVTVTCWALPLVLMTLPFIDDAYEPAGIWCWVKNDFKWRFLYFYIWRTIFVMASIAIAIHMAYLIHKSKGHRHSSNVSREHFQSDMRTLRLYPVVYFVLNIFPTINRLQNMISGEAGAEQHNFTLTLVHVCTSPLTGCVISLVYAVDTRTRQNLTAKNIRAAFQKWCHKATIVKEYPGSASSGHDNTDCSQ